MVLDFSNKDCPYRFVEVVFNDAISKTGVAGYRTDPKVAGVSVSFHFDLVLKRQGPC